MNCARAGELIAAALLGAADERELSALRAHLADCPECRAGEARLRRALAAMAEAAPPRGLAGRIVRGARRELSPLRSRRAVWLRLAAAAALLAAAGALWPALRRAARPAGRCPCWRFVAGDAGNCRRGDLPAGEAAGRLAWQAPVSGPVGAYKPLAWGDLVVVGAGPADRRRRAGGRLLAFEASTGRPLWRREFSSGDFYKHKGLPDRCIQDGKLYVADGARCLVLDAATGRDLARLAPPPGAAGWRYLSADRERLYGTGGDGRTVFCLRAADGRPLWTRRPGGAVFMPALADGRLYLHTDRGSLLALEARSGAQVWRRDCAVPGGRASLHAGGGRLLLLGEAGQVLACRAADGSRLWSARAPGAFLSGLAMGDEAVYLLGGSAALALDNGRSLWPRGGRSSGPCSPPAVAGGRVLAAGLAGGEVDVLSAAGAVLERVTDAPAQSCEGVIVSGGRVFTVGGGRLVAMSMGKKG